MLPHIASFFLLFSKNTIIIPVIVLGFIWLDKKIFYSAVYLVLLNMLFNHDLKISFQQPLPAFLHKSGYAFPSGHMQNATTFYGWLMLHVHRLLFKILLLVILIGVGFGLTYFGYHSYYEVLAGAFFALVLIGINISLKLQERPVLILLVGAILFIYFYIAHSYTPQAFWLTYYGYHWMAFYALLGIISSEKLFKQKNVNNCILSKTLTSILCFTGIFLIHWIFSSHLFSNLPLVLAQLKWFGIGFILPGTGAIVNYVLKK